MTATIKLRGGPLANKYQSVANLGERFVITKPVPFVINPLADARETDLLYNTQTGHYQKTNIRTKKGAYVFQWMGWEGEVIAR
jgi:hypothetical protein